MKPDRIMAMLSGFVLFNFYLKNYYTKAGFLVLYVELLWHAESARCSKYGQNVTPREGSVS